jgi:hypothetical protein
MHRASREDFHAQGRQSNLVSTKSIAAMVDYLHFDANYLLGCRDRTPEVIFWPPIFVT